MGFIKFLSVTRPYAGPVFIVGMVNSNEVVLVDHSKMNFVKVVQNQLLFRKLVYAVRKLILQDRHVTYRRIETTVDIRDI